MEKQNEELVKRIAKLVKENKAYNEQIKKLTKENEKLQKQNDRQKQILEKVSPDALKQLGKKEKTRTKRYKMVTVLFADVQGFAKISEQQNSQEMIDRLDQVFFYFDSIVEKYNIEKIKTIGDAYMCAGGIPEKNRTNPIEMVLAALEMQRYLQEQDQEFLDVWGLRLGIHTGPVSATAVGKKKISYDIKGETVNIASRMEASSEVGKVNISVLTYELVKEFFICEYYGKMPVKYKGDLEMYYVKKIRPELSVNGQGVEPNDKFNIKFKLIQFGDIQEVVLDKLEKELPDYLYYHNVKHTIDVVTQVELIGWGEAVSDEEILFLKTAALFHDAGHTIGYDNHEYYGTQIAKEMLPDYGYTQEQIDTVCEIIMATKLPPKPQNTLQNIICDSDLDYLGRSDFIPVSNTLYRELKAQDKIGTLNDWNKLQVKFLSGHQFFTETARSLREVNKQKQIERISKLITDNGEENKEEKQEKVDQEEKK